MDPLSAELLLGTIRIARFPVNIVSFGSAIAALCNIILTAYIPGSRPRNIRKITVAWDAA